MTDQATATGPNLALRKINLGCGYDKRPGYLNVDLNDFHGPDWVADISDMSGFPEGHYHEIVAQDVLEHMTREVSKRAFSQWARILSSDGVMKVRIPSIIGLLGLVRDHPWRADAHNHIMHLMFGSQAYNGDYHLSGFTPPILMDMCYDAGLIVIKAEVKDRWLYDLEFAKPRETTDSEFLHSAYFEHLGRTIDPGGLLSWEERLRLGLSTRDQVIEILQTSEENSDTTRRMLDH